MPAPLADLQTGQCHWPTGEDPGDGHMDGLLLCAESVPFEGCPYCDRHYWIAYPPTPYNRDIRRRREALAEAFRAARASPPTYEAAACAA